MYRILSLAIIEFKACVRLLVVKLPTQNSFNTIGHCVRTNMLNFLDTISTTFRHVIRCLFWKKAINLLQNVQILKNIQLHYILL